VRAQPADISVRFRGHAYPATTVFLAPDRIVEDTPAGRHPDVALLRLEDDVGPSEAPPFELALPYAETPVLIFGHFTSASVGGDTVTARFEGPSFHDDLQQKIVYRMKEGRIENGMSGAAALIVVGGQARIIGMVVESADVRSDFGGYITPVSAILPLLSGFVPGIQTTVQPGAPLPGDIEPLATGRSAGAPSDRAPLRVSLRVQNLIEKAERERRQFRPAAARATALEAVTLAKTSAAPALIGRALRIYAITLSPLASERARAKELAEEAAQLDGDPVQIERARALIAEEDGGPDAALAELTPGVSGELDIMRGSYLLGSDVSEVRRILAALPKSDADRPRARRLRALAAIAQGERDETLAVAETLVVPAGEDYTIGYVVIMAFVLGSVPPPFWPPLGGWLEAVSPEEVIETEDQHQRLRTAVDLAAGIIENSEIDGQERGMFESWRLAALALDSSRRDEASAYARELLEREDPNYRAISWAHAMSLLQEAEIDAVLDRLHDVATRGIIDPEPLLVLTVSLLQRDDGAGAEKLLRDNGDLFRSPHEVSRFRLLLAQALAVQGRFGDARELLPQITDPQGRNAVEASIRHRDGPPEEAHLRLRDLWLERGDPRVLFLASEIARAQGDWVFLADIGAELIARFRNESAGRFAIYGAFNTQRFEAVLERYAEFRALQIGIPADLLRIRALALERMGSTEALSAFEELLDSAPTDANYYSGGYAHVRRGDLAGAVVLAQRLERNEEKTPETLLAYASWIRSVDPDLARRLWRLAMPNAADNDNLVLLAFHLAHQLGISGETQALQEPMRRLGLEGRGGIHLVTQEEAIEQLRAHAQRTTEALARYRRGELPVHLLTSVTNADLVRTHVQQPRANAQIPVDSWMPIYVRHGGRSALDSRVDQRDVLLDTTSYLLAVDLGFLGELTLARQVYVSQSLGALLLSMLDDRAPGNLPQVAARRQLIENIDAGRFEIVHIPDGEIDSYAIENNLVIVDWGTLENESRHSASSARWCTPMTLVTELHRQGLLGDAARAISLTAFGNVREAGGAGPGKGDGLLLRWNTAEMLVEAQLLSALRDRRLVVEGQYIQHVRAELAQSANDAETARWIRTVLDELNESIASTRVITVPDQRRDESDTSTLELRVAFAAFSSDLPQHATIVIDDRFLNGYAARDDGKPVASLWDLVRVLRDAEQISRERALGLTLEMRRRGLMYIPIEQDEILTVVRGGAVADDSLTASEEMRVLERYVAAALLDTEALYARDESAVGPRMSQMPFLFELSMAVRSSIGNLLASGNEDDALRAEWVRDHLSPDGLPGYGIAGFASAAPQGTIDVEVAGFLTQYVS
jgi:tetratricopeptide (TPR) repeat protein